MENYCGKRLDNRYEIREIIGVGGMAVVYKAYDNIDDRIVAIKILKEEFLANEEFRRRFKNEAKAIAVLSHPNIVKVYDVSFGDRLQYIVMEYIEGITLKEYIEQQKVVNWKEAVHFVNQILKALQHAHDKGIVHRDIKPQNIMLLQDGTIKVSDFGIARFSRGDTRTMTESAIGSVHYISPEQARGEITDDKADIYSVGVVLYEMLTGQLPFQSDSAVSVAIMQLQQEAKRPRELNPDIPLGLEQITMRAMQKNPKNRYQSASEMLMDLDEFRKNPSVKFDYNYFVDNEPTKYVSAKGGVPVKPVVREQPPKTAAEDEEAEEDKKTNKTLPILFGVLAGVVVLVAIFVGVYFGVTARRVEVPNFVGKDFNEEISNNAEYTDNFTFETESVYSADAEPGTVLTQDPEAETKVRIHSTITLEIAYNEDSTQLTGIIGLNVDEAQSKLRGEGFEVKVITNYDPNAQEGVVYDTYPLEGSYVEDGQLITLYVATNDDPNATSVPYVLLRGRGGPARFGAAAVPVQQGAALQPGGAGGALGPGRRGKPPKPLPHRPGGEAPGGVGLRQHGAAHGRPRAGFGHGSPPVQQDAKGRAGRLPLGGCGNPFPGKRRGVPPLPPQWGNPGVGGPAAARPAEAHGAAHQHGPGRAGGRKRPGGGFEPGEAGRRRAGRAHPGAPASLLPPADGPQLRHHPPRGLGGPGGAGAAD